MLEMFCHIISHQIYILYTVYMRVYEILADQPSNIKYGDLFIYL